jgi:hypothetical protein
MNFQACKNQISDEKPYHRQSAGRHGVSHSESASEDEGVSLGNICVIALSVYVLWIGATPLAG